MKFLKIIFIGLIIIAVLLIGIGGYLGFIPGLSSLFGSNKPRDLGVRFTPEDYKRMESLTGATVAPMPDEVDATITIMHSGSHAVTASFTQEEFTSKVSNRPWKDNPFKDVQVKLNSDGSAEASGILRLPMATRFLSQLGIQSADVAAQAKKFNIPMADVPFYFKGTGTAANNHIEPRLQSVEIGRVPVPQAIISRYQQPLADLVTRLLSNVKGFSLSEATITNGKLTFKGTLPDIEYYR